MPNKQFLIGVTGGMGAGKTVVCQVFSVLGIPVYNADDRAKKLMETDRSVVQAIKSHISKEAYMPNGKLNRPFLANTVFKDGEMLEIINGIVHPAVARDFARWIKQHDDQPYLVKEAALLIESGSAKMLDYIVTVTAPMEVRLSRIKARDPQRSEQQIKDIISNQLSDEERIDRSDFVIENGIKALVIPQVLQIHEFLFNAARSG